MTQVWAAVGIDCVEFNHWQDGIGSRMVEAMIGVDCK